MQSPEVMGSDSIFVHSQSLLQLTFCAVDVKAGTFTFKSIDSICYVTISKGSATRCFLAENIHRCIDSADVIAVITWATSDSATGF